MHLGTMSPLDRIIRALVGAGLLAAYFLVHPQPTWALLGVIPLATALLNFCPMYALCRRQAVAEGPADHVQQQQALHEQGPSATETSDDGIVSEPPQPAESAAGEQAADTDHSPSRNRAKRGRKKARSRGRRGGGAAPRGLNAKKKTAPAVVDGKISHASDGTFASLVLSSDQPVLVDFWAEWCGPCKAIAPVLEDLAREHAGKARIVKVDVDSCPRTAGQFNIRSIPTLALFKDGEVQDVLVGLQSKGKLDKLLSRASA